MLRSLNSLFGSVIHALDGNLGHIEDFLFDDRSWTIRYLVVETGGWLSSRRVLISPAAAAQPDWETRAVPVNLNMEQVRNGPDVDTAKPVSRQHEIAMSQHYGWPAYWSMDPPMLPLLLEADPEPVEGDPHLRGVREVTTYAAEAADGELGNIDHLIIEDANWSIRYLVVRTGSWLSGQQLLLSTRWAGAVSWSHRKIVLEKMREDL